MTGLGPQGALFPHHGTEHLHPPPRCDHIQPATQRQCDSNGRPIKDITMMRHIYNEVHCVDIHHT